MNTTAKLITYDDYQHLPDDGNRYEIIGGRLFMTPAPSTNHQKVLGNLYLLIRNYTDTSGSGHVLMAPVDVVLAMTDVVQPDLVYISKEREHIITKKNIVAAPDLVIEILSEHTETIDRTRKKEMYERHGVKEYWIVYPEEKQIELYTLESNTLKLTATFTGQDKLTSKIIEGLPIQLQEVFNG